VIHSHFRILIISGGRLHAPDPAAKNNRSRPAWDRRKLKVGLNITDELLKAKSEEHSMGDT